jgi:hypothetical protein
LWLLSKKNIAALLIGRWPALSTATKARLPSSPVIKQRKVLAS